MQDNALIIAHRGESFDAPENTLASINLAWERDAGAVEIDVHLTADNKIAVIHDSNTNRTSGIYKKIRSQTIKALKQIDVGSYKGNRWTDQRIPSLEEVLQTVPSGKILFIEIKCGKEILPHLSAALRKSKLNPNQVKLIGFNLKTLSLARSYVPDTEIFRLRNLERSRLGFWKPNIDEIIFKTLKNGLNGMNIKAGKMIDRDLVDKIKSAGLKLLVWTVNDYMEAARLVKLGIDGITTDRAQWLKEKLQKNFKS